MVTLLYILLGISFLAPIYTYVLYPVVLRCLKKRHRKTTDSYFPSISIIVISHNKEKFVSKEKNILNSEYSNIKEIFCVDQIKNISSLLKIAKGDVIVITDDSSTFTNDTITHVIRPLSESNVGCVSGMVRKKPFENGVYRDSGNWKYENYIKELESNIGTLSGANGAIYAFKRDLAPKYIDDKINLDFYIPTYITELGYDVLFEPQAVAYEEDRTEEDIFIKHVNDGASGYRSIIKFWKLLFPRKGSFVFWSHRVMKWLVPFNMIAILIICCILTSKFYWATILLFLQLLVYTLLSLNYFLYTKKGSNLSGTIGKIINFGSYFLFLNIAWFLGLLKK